MRPWRFLDISDSSFANVTRHSQGGYIILLQHDAVDRLGGLCNVLDFKSNKSKRVCTSTMHSEAVSHITSQENCAYIQTYMHELEHPGLTASELIAAEGHELIPIIGITDCEDLHATLISPAAPTPSNKSLTLYLSALRELKELKRVKEYVWIDTRNMLANAMTKLELDGSITLLEIGEFLKTHVFTLSFPYKWGHNITEE